VDTEVLDGELILAQMVVLEEVEQDMMELEVLLQLLEVQVQQVKDLMVV